MAPQQTPLTQLPAEAPPAPPGPCLPAASGLRGRSGSEPPAGPSQPAARWVCRNRLTLPSTRDRNSAAVGLQRRSRLLTETGVLGRTVVGARWPHTFAWTEVPHERSTDP